MPWSHWSFGEKFALGLAITVVAVVTVVSLLFWQQPLRSVDDALVRQDSSGPDMLEMRTLQLVGPKAVDCGRVAPRVEPKKSTDCALAANRAGKPFRVRYDMQGIDSFVAVAIVRLPDGTVGVLSYDSDPMGGGGRAHEVVGARKCPTPVHLYATPTGHLTCFQPKPAAPRDPMSPTLDPY